MSVETSTALKQHVYPILTVILVPGFVAAAPWVAGVFWPQLQVAGTWEHAMVPISITALGITLIFGFVLENLGSRLEMLWADRWLKNSRPDLHANWADYLSLKTDGEIIGQRYLRDIRLRFKFELSMVPASFCSVVGLITSQLLGHGLGWPKVLTLAVVLALLFLILLFEIRGSAKVLAETRKIVIDACGRSS
jgi:hypothetical protein